MTIIQTPFLSPEQKEVVCVLWNKEYPKQLNYKVEAEFENYLNGLNQTNHYLGMGDDGKIEAWAITFLRESERWFAIILDEKIQGKGKGTLLLEKLKMEEETLNGWVIDHDNDCKQSGAAYKSPLRFYEINGFTVCAETRVDNEKISAVKIIWKRE
jgi:GNAT superfamily N-acetyltransferase